MVRMTIASHSHSSNTDNTPQQLSPLSLAPLSSLSSHRCRGLAVVDHSIGQAVSIPATDSTMHTGDIPLLDRVKLSDVAPYDGAPGETYLKAVEALSVSLTRYNAAVIELDGNDAAIMRFGIESARLYFRSRAHGRGEGRGVYTYRAGRALEDADSSPPCMAEIFRCMGKAARATLCAIARPLRLRNDVFNHLLDDDPLSPNETSTSVLVATYLSASAQNVRGGIGGAKPSTSAEFEKGLLTLIVSDSPGLQVCDSSGHWYLADSGLSPGSILLLIGKALSYATAGHRPAASYRAAPDLCSSVTSGGRTSLAFRLMPQSNAVLSCSPIAAAGHVVPQSYVRISVSQFMDDLSAEEDVLCTHSDNTYMDRSNTIMEPSLRSTLSDPLSGAFLEDAVLVSCGHSFGGLLLRKVLEAGRCCYCNSEIETRRFIPNHALRAAAQVVRHEDDHRLFHNSSRRKQRKEVGGGTDSPRRLDRDEGNAAAENGPPRGVQYPFLVNDKVYIKGNKRTPENIVGKEAVITSQCLNGWYKVKVMETGETISLQYRSLRKCEAPD